MHGSREYPLHAPGSLFRYSHCAVVFSVHGRAGSSEEAPGRRHLLKPIYYL